MSRRGFLQGLGLGVGVAMASPAWADRIRILPGPGIAAAGDQVDLEASRFFQSARVGSRRGHGGLTVFWLTAARPTAPLSIRTLEEARGELIVAEREQAAVPTLVVDNRGKTYVLLLAGEILLGGKQNRIVLEDVLVPPLSGPLTLPVYCVEQGRWTGRTPDFTSRGAFAAPRLREKVLERSDQQQVWAEVDRYASRLAAPSATGSYQAIHDKPEVQAHQKDVAGVLDARTAPGAQGAAAFVADTLVGLDLFQDPTLFVREWPKLLRGMAVESYGRGAGDEIDDGKLRMRLDDLLRSAGAATGSVRRGIGVGRLVEFRLGRQRGAALVAEGQVVHAAIL
jgi:hypothetical protein